MKDDFALDSAIIHGGPPRSQYKETAEAIYMTSGYVYDSAQEAEGRFRGDIDGYVYSRYGNPTVSLFEERMALIEGAPRCFGTASGMAAIFAALAAPVKAGDHIVASEVLFGSCTHILTQILPKWGVEATLVDGADLNAWKAAIRPNTKLFFCESPANPTLALVDLRAVADLAHDAGALFVLDNAFASPFVQKGRALGADVVVYSATKHIDGQGRCMGGAVCCDEAFYDETLLPFVRHTGPAMSPFNAWTLAKSLETLSLRMDRMSANAAAVATALDGHAKLENVAYPSLASHPQHDIASKQMANGGNMLAISMKGGREAAFETLNRLRLMKISNNLGDAKTLATHPATTTHRVLSDEQRAAFGIGEGLIRISIGLENADDLIGDILQALG